MEVWVQLCVSRDVLRVQCSPGEAASVAALKARLRDETGFHLDMMQLRLRGAVLADGESLYSQGVGEGALLELHLRAQPHAAHPSQLAYEDLLRPVMFLDECGSGKTLSPRALPPAPATVTIVLELKEDKMGSQLDPASLVELVCENESTSLRQTFGPTEAQRRGFVQWTSSHLQYERVMLLEVEAEVGVKHCDVAPPNLVGTCDLPPSLEAKRYNREGGETLHMGGDAHSWQRYTKRMPVPCIVRVDTASRQVKLTPREGLKAGQCYVVLIMNGGRLHTQQLSGAEHGTRVFDDDGGNNTECEVNVKGHTRSELMVLSDHLIFCVVATASQSPVSLSTDVVQQGTNVRVVHHMARSSSSLQKVDFTLFLQHHHSAHNPFTVSVSTTNGLAAAKCKDLKQAILKSTGIATSDQQLVINGQVSLCDHDSLAAFCLVHHEECPPECTKHCNDVILIPFIPHLRNNMAPAVITAISASVQPYIRSVFPASGTANVSTHVLIKIQFTKIMRNITIGDDGAIVLEENGRSSMESKVALQFFAQSDVKLYSSDIECDGVLPGDVNVCVDRDMETALGTQEAQRRGFRRWATDSQTPSHRLLVLEIASDEQQEQLIRNRYDFSPWRGKNGWYRGGDNCSWQRYTDKIPLPGELEICETENCVLFRPAAPLKPKTTYVVVITNGIPIATHYFDNQGGGISGPCFTRSEEDTLFFFSTEAARRHQPVGGKSGVIRNSSELLDDDNYSDNANGDDDKDIARYDGQDTLCYGLGSSGDPPLCVIS